MICERIELENFGSHASSTLDFDGVEAAVLTGPTGSGKSTVIDAIRFLLTGRTRVKKDIDQQVRRGENKMSVRGVFRFGGERYKIERARSKKGRSGTSLLEVSIFAGGQWVPALSGNTSEKQALLDKLCNGGDEFLLATMFAMQGKSGAFAEAEPADRIAVVSKIRKTERWPIYATKLDKMIAVATAKRDGLLPELERRLEVVRRGEAAVGEIPSIEKEIGDAVEDESALTGRVAHLEQELARARAQQKEADAILAEAERARKDVQAAEAALRKLHDRIAERESAAGRMAEAEKGCHDLAWAKDAEREAGDLVAQAELALREVEKEHREHEGRVRAALSRQQAARAEARRQLDEIVRSRRDAVDAAARAVKEREAELSKVRQLAQQKEKARRELHDVNKSWLDGARNRLRVLQEVPCGGEGPYAACGLIKDAVETRDKVPKVEEALRGVADPIPIPETWDDDELEKRNLALEAAKKVAAQAPPPVDAQAEVDAATAAIAELGGGPDLSKAQAAARGAREKHQAAVRSVANLSGWPAALEAAKKAEEEVAGLYTEVPELKAGVDRAKERAAEVVARASAITPAAVGDLERQVGAVKQELAACRQRHAFQSHRLEERRQWAAELDQARAAVAEVQAQVDGFQKEVDRLRLLEEEYRAIPMALLAQAMPTIEQAANDMLAALGTSHRVRLDDQKKNKSNDNVKDTLDIWVTDDNGFEAPYETFSGGERFMIDIALREGLGQLQATAARADDPPMLIIDEGWGSVDPDLRKEVAKVIDKVVRSKRFSLVLCVSHEPDLIDTFPTRIACSRSAHGSTVRVLRAA